MDLGISGLTAIVCASSRGLGRGCAEALAQNGVNIVINGRDQKALEETSAYIKKKSKVEVTTVLADLCTLEGQKALLSACPNPDILINNNGGPPLIDYREIDRDDMIEGLVMNMITPIELISTVVDNMASRGFGRIVNITSLSVKMPMEGLDLSSGARAGLTAFIAGITPKFTKYNVTINNLLPGLFDTDRLKASTKRAAIKAGKSESEIAIERSSSIPAKRFGTVEEFGQTCAFLCSIQAGYITGQNILIDGGRYPHTF